MKTFEDYFAFLIEFEGSVYENHPNDPGGPTKYGIDPRSHPDVNIRALTLPQAREIYIEDYWTPTRCEELPAPLSYAVMDCAVNCGRTRAVKWLQQTLGVSVDGVFGPRTMAAVKGGKTAGELANRVLDHREAHYRALGAKPRFRVFLKGWLRRNDELRRRIASGK
jgi:lysozyme family protein